MHHIMVVNRVHKCLKFRKLISYIYCNKSSENGKIIYWSKRLTSKIVWIYFIFLIRCERSFFENWSSKSDCLENGKKLNHIVEVCSNIKCNSIYHWICRIIVRVRSLWQRYIIYKGWIHMINPSLTSLYPHIISLS